jgi:hypothetical protein
MSTITRRPPARNRRSAADRAILQMPPPPAPLPPIDVGALAASPPVTAAAAALNVAIAERAMREAGARDLDGAADRQLAAGLSPDLAPALVAALTSSSGAKILAADTAAPAVGDHRLRGTATIRVDCTIAQGEAVSAVATWRPDPIAALAVLARQAGIKLERVGEAVEAALVSGAAELLEPDYLAVVEAAADRVKAAWQVSQPSQCRRGACRVTGDVALVGYTPE